MIIPFIRYWQPEPKQPILIVLPLTHALITLHKINFIPTKQWIDYCTQINQLILAYHLFLWCLDRFRVFNPPFLSMSCTWTKCLVDYRLWIETIVFSCSSVHPNVSCGRTPFLLKRKPHTIMSSRYFSDTNSTMVSFSNCCASRPCGFRSLIPSQSL
jgi:hypothetical protein